MSSTALSIHGGGYFDLAKPRAEDVRLSDIAWSLSGQRRYLNHTDLPVTVAEHLLLAAYLVPAKHRLAALLHDAEETYTGDIIRPVAALLRVRAEDWDPIGELSRLVRRAVFQAFGIADQLPLAPEVELADTRAFAIECGLAFTTKDDGPLAITGALATDPVTAIFYHLQKPLPPEGQEAWVRVRYTEAVERAVLDNPALWFHTCLPGEAAVAGAQTVLDAAQEREPPSSGQGAGSTGPVSGLSGEAGGQPPAAGASRERGEPIPQILLTLLGLDPASAQAKAVACEFQEALRLLVSLPGPRTEV